MFEAIREEKITKVVFKGIDNCAMTVCVIPHYYQQDMGIAEVIAKTLNEQDKYIMDLHI